MKSAIDEKLYNKFPYYILANNEKSITEKLDNKFSMEYKPENATVRDFKIIITIKIQSTC